MNILQEGDYEKESMGYPSSLLINDASRTLEQFTPTPFSPKPELVHCMTLQDLDILVSCLYVYKGYLCLGYA